MWTQPKPQGKQLKEKKTTRTDPLGLTEQLSRASDEQRVQSLLGGCFRFGCGSGTQKLVTAKTQQSRRSWRRPSSWYLQGGGAGRRRHPPVVKPVLTQTLPQTRPLPLQPGGGFSREGGLQLGSLGAHLLVLSFDVVLTELTLVLRTDRQHVRKSRHTDRKSRHRQEV